MRKGARRFTVRTLYLYLYSSIHTRRGRLALMSRWLQATWHLQATPLPIEYGSWNGILLSIHKAFCYASFRSIVLYLVGYSVTNPSRASTLARLIPRATGTAQSPTILHYVHLHTKYHFRRGPHYSTRTL